MAFLTVSVLLSPSHTDPHHHHPPPRTTAGGSTDLNTFISLSQQFQPPSEDDNTELFESFRCDPAASSPSPLPRLYLSTLTHADTRLQRL